MAKRRVGQAQSKRSNAKYSIVSLLLLAAFSIYVTLRDNHKVNPGNDAKRNSTYRKAEGPPRYLTTFTGKVIGIKDGDTFEVLYDGQPERVRLSEIDCPENSQAFGKAAKQYASDLCFSETVTVSSNGKRDQYGRVVGTIITEEGINVNEELVKAGLAWHYKQYSDSEVLAQLEEEARASKTGLWEHKRPMAPWEWRKKKRRKKRN